MFVDASAIVAILTGEEDDQELVAALGLATDPITSAISVWEAAASISRKTGKLAELELGTILEFLDVSHVRVESIDMAATAAAIAAFDRYGRGSGHAADLNLGDCFTYAFAKSRGIPLLYKGKDFPRTDVEPYWRK